MRYVGTVVGDAVSGEYPQDYIRYVGTVVGDAVSGEYPQDYIRYARVEVSGISSCALIHCPRRGHPMLNRG